MNIRSETTGGLMVNADETISSYKSHKKRVGFDDWTWKLNDGEPLVLKLFEDGEPEF